MRARARGQVLVEFSLLSPVLIGLLFAAMQFGYASYTYNNLAKAVSDGARFAGMRTYYGACTTSCSSDTAFFTAVQNVVLYGTPSPTGTPNPIVHNLAAGNIVITVSAVNSVPVTVTVAITNYSMSLPLSTVTLTSKPAAMFPYIGRYAHPI